MSRAARPGRPAEWSAQRILDALRAWQSRYGAAPRYAQWRTPPSSAWPSATTVCNVFGYWSAALAAAGLPEAAPGPARDELRADAAVKLIADGSTQAETAKLLGCSATAVRDWLRARGADESAGQAPAPVELPQLALFG